MADEAVEIIRGIYVSSNRGGSEAAFRNAADDLVVTFKAGNTAAN
jgi:hypothetical protein